MLTQTQTFLKQQGYFLKILKATKMSIMLETSGKLEYFFEIIKVIIPMSLRKILFYGDIVASAIDQEANTFLDVGGGKNDLLTSVRRFKKQLYFVNVDIFLPYLKFSKTKRYYDDCVLCDIRYLPFKGKSFDLSVCLHVLEHLSKEDGLKLIEQLETITRKQVIVATPVGFQELHTYDGNPYQTHKSGWTPKEFEEKGFKVRGSCGLRKLRGERASPILGSNQIMRSINFSATYVSQLFTYYNPDLAWEMVCIKF
jgi:hypothetical protein